VGVERADVLSSLLVDRSGGAESRVSGLQQMLDWRFPREDADEGSVPPWQPTYVDYLFLAFCTATSFGPTEAMPMTARAKFADDGGKSHLSGDGTGDRFPGHRTAGQLTGVGCWPTFA